MKVVKVYSQKELDTTLATEEGTEIWICGTGRFVITETPGRHSVALRDSSHAVLRGSSHAVLRDSSHAVLWDSSHAVLWDSSHAELWDSSHAELWGSSHAVLRDSSHAVLRGSSHAVLWDSSHAELWGSSHAELRGSSHAVLWGSSHAVADGYAQLRLVDATTKAHATKHVVITRHAPAAICDGGIIIDVPPITTAEQWCEHYGATVEDGVAILYKGLNDQFVSPHGGVYLPGTVPAAPDWDGGEKECGGGFHFSPHPEFTRRYNPVATKYVACPVSVDEIIVHHPAEYPDKIKAPRVCAPIVEVDRHGQPVPISTMGKRA